MVYSYTISKVIDNSDSLDVKDVHKILRLAANECNIEAFEFRNAMFSWKTKGSYELHDGVVVSFWSQDRVSDEKLDAFAMKLNEKFDGAKACYLESYVEGAIVNVYRPDEEGNAKIDRITS